MIGLSSRMKSVAIAAIALSTIGMAFSAHSASADAVNLKVGGSSTVAPIASASIAPFQSEHPGITVSYETHDSGWGISNVRSGAIDVGASSRALTSAELTSPNVTDTVIGRDGIAFIVKDGGAIANCLNNISADQAAQIYTAGSGISNLYWDNVQAGCPHQLVVPRSREIGSGTRQSLLDLVKDGGGTKLISDAAEQSTITATGVFRPGGSQQMVDEIKANQYQIGYVGYGYATEPGVKFLTYNGVALTAANVMNGTYGLGRDLHMLYLTGTSNTTAIAYVNWMLSFEAQQIVEDEGFISLAPDWDVNCDHEANVSDIGTVGSFWNQTGRVRWVRQDANRDGAVNIVDVVAVGQFWGLSW